MNLEEIYEKEKDKVMKDSWFQFINKYYRTKVNLNRFWINPHEGAVHVYISYNKDGWVLGWVVRYMAKLGYNLNGISRRKLDFVKYIEES